MARQIIKCNQYDLFNTTPVTGQIYFCTDSRVLYKDNGPAKDSRSRFNAIVCNSDNDRLNNIKPVVGKFYYVVNTNQLWLFDTRWVLKIGSSSQYNAYAINNSAQYGGNVITPVINSDETIVGVDGDKIIDNNGLLGDGSVAIRDSNRIIRGLTKVDNTNQQLTFSSYLDNGFLFIPNANLPYKDLSTSLGALHLTVDRDISDINQELDLSGQAYYYGTWNNYGDMYLINRDNSSYSAGIDYTPNLDKVIVKLFFTSSFSTKDELDEEVQMKSFITIRPISSTAAVANVVILKESDATSVTYNDVGELLYTDSGSLEENKIIDCKRNITYENGYVYCSYIFPDYDNAKIIVRQRDSISLVTMPEIWSDTGECDDFKMSTWTKHKVLTDADIDIADNDYYIKRYVY